jgi:hypothetical protein
MEYLADHPPAHIILAAVHMKPQRSKKRKSIEQPNMADELRSEVMALGGSVRGPLPAVYRDK